MSYNSSFLRDENIVDKLKNQIKFFHRRQNLPKGGSKQYNDDLAKLKSDGFVMLTDVLKQSELHELQATYRLELEENLNFEFPCLSQTKIDPIKHKAMIDNFLRYHPQEFQKFGMSFERKDIQNYKDAIEKFHPSTLKTYIPQNLSFFKVWLHPRILDLVEGYMGLRPYMTEAYIRRNFKAEYRVMNHHWHRDNNHPFYLLKAFIFLTDVEVEHGPHEYIANSVNDRTLNGKTYYTDEEVDNLYPKGSNKRIISIVKAGTIVLEDTRGLHRAMVPKSGQRDLGYAVFHPIRIGGKMEKKYYTIKKSIYEELDQRQKSYIMDELIFD